MVWKEIRWRKLIRKILEWVLERHQTAPCLIIILSSINSRGARTYSQTKQYQLKPALQEFLLLISSLKVKVTACWWTVGIDTTILYVWVWIKFTANNLKCNFIPPGKAPIIIKVIINGPEARVGWSYGEELLMSPDIISHPPRPASPTR
jgi:hypothetical protein